MFENSKTIALARELAKAVQQEECYKAFMNTRVDNDNDEELQALIGKFNLAQMNMDEELSKEDKDNDAIEQYSNMLQDLYTEIMANKNMSSYQAAYNEVDKLMHYVNAIISAGFSGEDPDSVTEAESCSGNCSTCGGCH